MHFLNKHISHFSRCPSFGGTPRHVWSFAPPSWIVVESQTKVLSKLWGLKISSGWASVSRRFKQSRNSELAITLSATDNKNVLIWVISTQAIMNSNMYRILRILIISDFFVTACQTKNQVWLKLDAKLKSISVKLLAVVTGTPGHSGWLDYLETCKGPTSIKYSVRFRNLLNNKKLFADSSIIIDDCWWKIRFDASLTQVQVHSRW